MNYDKLTYVERIYGIGIPSCLVAEGRIMFSDNKVLYVPAFFKESLMLSVDAMYKVSGKLARYEKTVDLSWPLVSNIICLWDSWLLGDRCKSTAV